MRLPFRNRELGLVAVAILFATATLFSLRRMMPSSLSNSVKVVQKSSGPRVAVIGAAGNIGSELTSYLQSRHFEFVAFDSDPSMADSLPFPLVVKHSQKITASLLKAFDVVVFLGGCTGRQACQRLSSAERWDANVRHVLNLASKMNPEQHLIAASTSAVTEGKLNAVENTQLNESLLDEYSTTMLQREMELKKFSSRNHRSPKITMLRFGTVIGVSKGQRTDLLVPSLFRSAYLKGVMKVDGPNIMRSFLWLQDLVRLVETIIQEKYDDSFSNGPLFSVWHVASFSATILKVATTVASINGARIDVSPSSYMQNATTRYAFRGFSIDSTAFSEQYNFSFLGTLETVLTEFDRNIPDSITAKGIHNRVIQSQKPTLESIPCPVCGSKDLQLALDLGDQPFANDFRNDSISSMKSPRFPLKLVRCRRCNHFHLSHIASREELFSNYLYVSGTSGTLSEYFKWLAQKVKQESGNVEDGNVLEIACNDGSQLDQFKKLGWNTYGVDPAANIVPTAQSKGHIVKVGFWGSPSFRFPNLPRGEALTAIVAQNVLAHVPDPISFLRACADIMGPKTLLYVQTSQCNMHQLGQFDTAYHEHIYFFTGHSFLKAAELAGLYVTSFETTPIHGTSCLVTMKLPDHIEIANIPSPTLQTRLDEEVLDGITGDFFYEKYESHAHSIRSWISENIHELKKDGFIIGGYGAAAKGMTLLHFLFNLESQNDLISFILDDSPLKQNRYCPASIIPVRSTNSIVDIAAEGKPIALIILAWNFWQEIEQKLKILLKGIVKSIHVILPFPVPKMLILDLGQNATVFMREMALMPTPIPNSIQSTSRNKTLMISHMNNEEVLLPFFIIHHAPMFDKVIIIDYESTDHSIWLIEQYAPPSWRVVNSTTGRWFGAHQTDQQVVDWERKYPDHWAIALTITEFFFSSTPNLRQLLYQLHQYNQSKPFIYEIKMYAAVGNDTFPLRHFVSLPEQRRVYMDLYPPRYLHLGTSLTHTYSVGRHGYHGSAAERSDDVGFIMKYSWTPWPEVIDRKLSIDDHRTQFDKDNRLGFHHALYHNREELEKVRSAQMISKELLDLCSFKINHSSRVTVRIHREFFSAYGTCCRP